MTVAEGRPVRDLFDLSGKVALVTGATGQLGKPMAEALAEQGAHVVINSRTEESCENFADRLSKDYQRSIAASGDVTSGEDVRRIISTVDQTFGTLDILVNNAYSGSLSSFEEMTTDEFRSAVDGALTSSFLTTREALPLLKETRSSVINIASIYGVVAPDHSIYGETGLNNPVNYGVAKAGVVQLTKWVATRFANDGIRANVITPGGFYQESLEGLEGYTDDFVPNYESRTPLGRMGNPEDLKGPVTFLASDASQWMTGHNLIVDGGWTVW